MRMQMESQDENQNFQNDEKYHRRVWKNVREGNWVAEDVKLCPWSTSTAVSGAK